MQIITQDVGEKLLHVYRELHTSGRLRKGVYREEEFPYVVYDLDELPEGITLTQFQREFAFGVNRASQADRIRVRLENNLSGSRTTHRRLITDLGYLIFVCSRQKFQPLWAVHEYVEGFTTNHEYAMRETFEEAKRRGPDLLERFARYSAKNLFKKLEINPEALRSIVPAETASIFEEAGLLQ
jgi:hypothetical protein